MKFQRLRRIAPSVVFGLLIASLVLNGCGGNGRNVQRAIEGVKELEPIAKERNSEIEKLASPNREK